MPRSYDLFRFMGDQCARDEHRYPHPDEADEERGGRFAHELIEHSAGELHAADHAAERR